MWDVLRKRVLDWWRRFASPTLPAAVPSGPTNWCLVGNIVDEHPFGEAKEIRRGSKHFAAGTKVYCLPSQWGDGYEKVVTVGLCRRSRRWITVVTPARLITNWRAAEVYKPAVLPRLRRGFNGFAGQWESREQVEAWAEAERNRKRP